MATLMHIPMPDPSLDVLSRALWFGDRLTEAGVPFAFDADVHELSALYLSTYRNGGELGSFEVEVMPERDTWAPVNLGELPERPPTQPTLGNVGIVYPGMRHVFSGPPESAKTIAAYVIALYVVRTGELVVLIDFEMGAYDARSRLRELGASDADLAGIRYLEPDVPATNARMGVLAELKPALVVIDAAAGAYDLQGLDDNKRGDVEKLARLYVSPFWRRGIATIFIDHVVKNSETRGHYAIGSEHKLGGADVHLGFETIAAISRGTSGRYRITTHKDRGGYLKRGHLLDLVLESDARTHEIRSEFTVVAVGGGDAEVPYFRPTHLMEKCSVWLEGQAEPVTRIAVFEALAGRKAYVLKALSALVAEGFLEETDGPRQARLVSSIRPYREADPTCNPPTVPAVPIGSRTVPGTEPADGSRGSLPLRGGTAGPAATDPPEPNEPAAVVPVQSSWFDDDLAYLDGVLGEEDES